MSQKGKFQEIITSIRDDIKNLKTMQDHLSFKIPIVAAPLFESKEQVITKTKEWIIDSYLDKFFETDSRIMKLCKVLDINSDNICKLGQAFTKNLGSVALNLGVVQLPARSKQERKVQESTNKTFYEWLSNAEINLHLYSNQFDRIVITATNLLNQTNWAKMSSVDYEDFILPTKRKKYETAREELEKAKQAVKDAQWDEVLNHLRPAVDLALKEKFGFKRIQPMKYFISDAEKFDFNLPSYTMLYDIFDEGTKRIHEGKLNTPYECQKALEFVAGFIDRLDLIDVTQQKIDEFKQQCKFVD